MRTVTSIGLEDARRIIAAGESAASGTVGQPMNIAVDDGAGDERLAAGIARALWTTLHPPGAK